MATTPRGRFDRRMRRRAIQGAAREEVSWSTTIRAERQQALRLHDATMIGTPAGGEVLVTMPTEPGRHAAVVGLRAITRVGQPLREVLGGTPGRHVHDAGRVGLLEQGEQLPRSPAGRIQSPPRRLPLLLILRPHVNVVVGETRVASGGDP